MNNLFGFGCQTFVYHSSNNNHRKANIFRKLFGIQSKQKTKKINATTEAEAATAAAVAVSFRTASRAASIIGLGMEATTPNRVPYKQNQISGQLYKYTNVVKGWQYRWFTVDPQAGTLSYYLCENSADDSAQPIVGSTPRWQEHLAGAVVCPSDEDSRTFTISCASGDILKLRAINARARQEWVDGLRNIAECHTQSIGSQFEMLPLREVMAASDAFGEARQQLHNTELCNAALARSIESASLPLKSTDPDLLLLKAISAASTHCLLQCMSLLQRHHEIASDIRSEAAF